jgi:type I site-specific restriction endonuclease
MFPLLKYPSINIRLKHGKENQVFIFDNIRKKWLLLTPEEWVRQHAVNYLITEKKYKPSLISLEKEIELNGTKKRYDIVVYDKSLNPFIIIECKAPEIALTDSVLEQALRYNLVLKVPFIMITNGMNDLVIKDGTPIKDLPIAD